MGIRKLIILSPNDRYNYGDLLFSYIIQYKLKGCYDEFIKIASVNNDLTSVGGEKVRAITDLVNLPSENSYDLILGGGESLLSDWLSCYTYVNSNFKEGPILSFTERFISRVFGIKNLISFRNFYGRRLMSTRTEFPFSISKGELPLVNKIFYNSIGAVGITPDMLSKSKIINLQAIDYISVRDHNSFKVLTDYGIKTDLVPDSAILMSTVFSDDFLSRNIQRFVKQYICSNKYILFQVNKEEYEKHKTEIITFLNNILDNTDLNVCLCPIGYASGHDDPMALKDIFQILNNDRVSYFGQNTIWDIMSLIAHSFAYVGSSLHGVITAMSFSVPYLALYRNKTISYIIQWGINNDNVYSSDESIFKNFQKIVQVDKNLLIRNRERLIDLSEKSFHDICYKAKN